MQSDQLSLILTLSDLPEALVQCLECMGPMMAIAANWGTGSRSLLMLSCAQRMFKALPQPLIVEHSFAWLDRYRPLSKESMQLFEDRPAICLLAAIHHLLQRLAPAQRCLTISNSACRQAGKH